MQVKSIAHSAILLTIIKLLFAIKIFVLSIFEWPFYTGFYVMTKSHRSHGKSPGGGGGIPRLGLFLWLKILNFNIFGGVSGK